MNKINKKYYFTLIGTLAFVTIVSVYANSKPSQPAPKLGNIQTTSICFKDDTPGTSTARYTRLGFQATTETSAQTNFIPNATSTFSACNIQKAELFHLDLSTIATASAAVIDYQLEFSEDGGTWFAEDANRNTNPVQHESKTVHSWTPSSTSGTTSISVLFNNPGHAFVRPNFRGKVATSSIWYQIVKKEFNN